MSVDKVLGILCCGVGIALVLSSWFAGIGWGWGLLGAALFVYGWYRLRRADPGGDDWTDAAVDLLDVDLDLD